MPKKNPNSKLNVLVGEENLGAIEHEQDIGLDLETSGLSPWRDKIAVVSIKAPKSDTHLIIHVRGHLSKKLKKWLGTRERLTLHNGAGFDLLFMHQAGIDVFTPKVYDTMLGELALLTTDRRDVSVSLKSTMYRRTGKRISKDVDHSGWMNPRLTESQVNYCVDDIKELICLREAQLKRADPEQLNAIGVENDLIPVLVKMSCNGMPIDLAKLGAFLRGQEKNLVRVTKRLSDRLGPINFGSHVQLKRALVQANPEWELKSTGAEVLDEIVMYPGELADICNDLLELRHAAQRKKMYRPEWVQKYVVDGVVHPRFWACVSKDTLIEMPRDLSIHPDGIPITDIRPGMLVYTFNEHNVLVLRKVRMVARTGRKVLYRLKADPSHTGGGGTKVELKLTADHKVKLVSGKWKRLNELVIGDRLLCMPTRSFADHYPMLMGKYVNGKSGERVDEHLWVGKQLYEVPSTHIVHHRDENHLNSSVDNLEVLSRGDHKRHHSMFSNDKVLNILAGKESGSKSAATRSARKRGLIPLSTIKYTAEYVRSALNGECTDPDMQPNTIRKVARKMGLIPIGFKVSEVTGQLVQKKSYISGSNHVVTSIERIGIDEVWDMEVEGTHTFIGNGIALHNCSTDTGRMSSSDPNCFSDDTETLTTSGWKLFKDIGDIDLVAQFNQETEVISFERPLDFIKKEFSGNMVAISNTSNTINLLVTPDHDCLVYDQGHWSRKEGYRKIHASDYPISRNYYQLGFLEDNVSQISFNKTDDCIKMVQQYSGYVYCVTMPKGTVIVRRMGAAVITGQCQQVPADMRSIYGGTPDHKVVWADLSQAEIRVAAAVANCSGLRRVFSEGLHVHTDIASKSFRVDYNKVDDGLKRLAKGLTFTMLFGGSWETFQLHARQAGTDLSDRECQKIFKDFFTAYPGMRDLKKAATNMCYSHRNSGRPLELRLPTGLKRLLVGWKIKPSILMNTMIQGGAAAGMKFALLEAHRRGLTDYLSAAVHDELVAAWVPNKMADEYGHELVEVLNFGLSQVMEDVPSEAVYKVGDYWGK